MKPCQDRGASLDSDLAAQAPTHVEGESDIEAWVMTNIIISEGPVFELNYNIPQNLF